jgi:hypothetical protein
MSSRAYTVLGWLMWQIGKRLARYEIQQNKAKVGAGATVLAVLAAGIVAAKLAAGDSDD